MYCSSFLRFPVPRTDHSLKIPSEGIWSFSTRCHSVEAFHADHGPDAAKLSSAPPSVTAAFGSWTRKWRHLNVCIISISVLIISVGEPGILLAVRDSSKRRVVVETRVKDLVHDFLRLFPANVPHGQDGAKGTASDTLLSKEKPRQKCQIRDTNLKPVSKCYIYPSAGTWWCCFKPKLNLAASLLKVQSPLRLAARIWNNDTKKVL